jgi:hypothetical protein
MSEEKKMSSNNSVIVDHTEDMLISHFVNIIRDAPAYGWCGIDLTFHDGRVVKVEKRIGISIKEEAPSRSGAL